VFVDMLDLKDSMLCLIIANVLGVDWALKEKTRLVMSSEIHLSKNVDGTWKEFHNPIWYLYS
jgi:hypothetical protein